jgi:hypothetical protein
MVIEETFELSDKLIEEIEYTQLGEQYEITVFPNRLLFGALSAVEYAIAGYYNLKYGLLNKPEEYQDVDEQLGDTQMIFHEALVNAIWHGANNEHPVKTAIFLGEKGVCFGFYDGGDYFKREDIKEIWEAKKRSQIDLNVTHRGKSDGQICANSPMGGGGSYHLFRDSDIIEVDTNRGILYCVRYLSSIVEDEKLLEPFQQKLEMYRKCL